MLQMSKGKIWRVVSISLLKRHKIMDDPIYTFFRENLATVSKEELLKALENALRSADYWREACLGRAKPEPLKILPEEH